MKRTFTMQEFLDLQKTTDVKLRYRDTCISTTIEVSEPSEELKEHIREFFKKRGKEVIFECEGKYVYTK